MIVLHVPCQQRLNFNSEKWGCYTFLSEFQIRSKWRAKLARRRKGRWCGEVPSLVLGSMCVSFFTVVTKCLTFCSVKQEELVLAHSLSMQPILAGKARWQEPQPRELQGGSSHLS